MSSCGSGGAACASGAAHAAVFAAARRREHKERKIPKGILGYKVQYRQVNMFTGKPKTNWRTSRLLKTRSGLDAFSAGEPGLLYSNEYKYYPVKKRFKR